MRDKVSWFRLCAVVWIFVMMWGIQAKAQQRFYATNAFYAGYDKAICVMFHGAQNVQIPNQAVKLTPSVKNLKIVRESAYNNKAEYEFQGDFQPETLYKLELTTEIKNQDGVKLSAPASFLVKVPPLTPHLDVLTNGMVMPLHRENKSLPLKLVNIDNIKVEVGQIYRNNFILGDSYDREFRNAVRQIDEKDIQVTLPPNTNEKAKLMLAPLFPVDKPGTYYLSITAENKKSGETCWDEQKTTIILTDLALAGVVEQDGTKAVVSVRSIATSKAVEGAKVTLFSDKHQLVATAMTDAAGLARFSFDGRYASKQEKVMLAMVEKDDDFNVLNIRSKSWPIIHSRSFDYTSCGPDVEPIGPSAFVYTERGVMRPGEKIICSAFVRQRTEKDIKPCGGFPCVLTVSGPLVGTMSRQKVKTDAYGFVSQEFTIPADGLTGTYVVNCEIEDGRSIGETDFLVTTYRPDRIQVKQTVSKTIVKPQESFSSIIEANYYFGQPVESGKIKFSYLSKAAKAPKHWKDWTVGVVYDKYGTRPIGSAELDLENGSAMVTDCQWQPEKAFFPHYIILAAQVSVEGEHTVSHTVTIMGNPTEQYLGLHEPEADGGTGDVTMDYKVLRYTQDDVPVTPFEAVTISLKRITWNYNLVEQNDSMRYEWEECIEDYGEPFTVQLTAAEGKIKLPKLENGRYELHAVIDDAHKTVMQFWHSQGEGGRRTPDPRDLTFETDKDIYNPGDTAILTFDVMGDGYAFAVSGEFGIQDGQAMTVKDGRNEIRVKIPEWIPTEHYYCGVTVATGAKNPYIGFSVVALKLRQAAHQLKVDIEAPQVARPQKTVDFEVRLSDENGKAQSGGVHVYLVDEGILALTGYKVPEIFKYFYGPRNCNMRFCDIYNKLFPDVELDGAMKIGGDGMSGMRVKVDVLKMADPAIVSLGLVPVSDSGVAKVSAKIPEHQGAMRIMCVASNDQRVGTAEQSMIIRDEIGVQASLPRVVAPGDEFTVHFLLSNMELPAGGWTFKVNLPEGLKALNATEGTGEMAPKTSKHFTFRCQAQENLGTHKLSYVLTMGNVKKTGDVEVTVRTLNPPVTLQNTIVLNPGESKTLELNHQDWLTNSANAKVTISKSQFAGIVNALEWLNNYPYGCLEQTTSCALPLMYATYLKNAGFIDDAGVDMQRPKLQDAFRAILPMYRGDGTFSLWPGGTTVFNDGVYYAGYFLFLMNRRYPGSVTEKMLDAVNERLINRIDDGDTDMRCRAFACYVCSLRNQPAQNALTLTSYARLLPKKNVSDMTSLLCGAALVNLGYAAEGAKLVRDAFKSKVWLEENSLFTLSDAVSRAGMCLMIGMEVCPEIDDTALLANWLMKQMRKDGKGWGTTQNNAWATIGLSCYCSEQKHKNGKIRIAFNNGVATEDKLSNNLDFDIKGNDKVNVSNVGDTPVFIEMRIQGNPRTLQTMQDGKISISRIYLNDKGERAIHVKHGDLVTVQLTVTSKMNLENVVIVDMLPGCLEIEDDKLLTRLKAEHAEGSEAEYRPQHCEKRDDRFIVVGDFMDKENYVIRYHARVVTPGTFMVPPAIIEAMYDPEIRSVFAERGKLVAE